MSRTDVLANGGANAASFQVLEQLLTPGTGEKGQPQPLPSASHAPTDSMLLTNGQVSEFAQYRSLLEPEFRRPEVGTKEHQEHHENNEQPPENQTGLGLFDAPKYMSGAKGRDANSGGQNGFSLASQSSIQQIELLAQLVQAQTLRMQSSLATPLSIDAINMLGEIPSEEANPFEQLRPELEFQQANNQHQNAQNSGVAKTNAAKVTPIITVMAAASAAIAATQLERAQVLAALDSRHQARNEPIAPGTSTLHSAVESLRALVNKVQQGDGSVNLSSVTAALQPLLSQRPEIAAKLQHMMGDGAAAASPEDATQQNISAQTQANSVGGTNEPAKSIHGWSPVAQAEALEHEVLPVLNKPRQLTSFASGSVNAKGLLTGVSLDAGALTPIRFELQPDKGGNVTLLATAASSANTAAFSVTGHFGQDAEQQPIIDDGKIMWNSDSDGVKLAIDGSAAFTADGGKTWQTLPYDKTLRYRSPDGSLVVSYDPIERKVALTQMNRSAKVTGSAAMQATGFGVAFSNLRADQGGTLG